MAEILRSFDELSKVKIETEKQWTKWDSHAFRANSLELAMRPLAFWLDARFDELIREKVHRDDIKVQMRGQRCTISVQGVPRFEFKVKVTMEKCGCGSSR